jgi:hypothetical protein
MPTSVVQQVVDGSHQTLGAASDHNRLEIGREGDAGRVASGALERRLDEAVQPGVFKVLRWYVTAGHVDQVRYEGAELFTLLDHVRQQLPPVLLTEHTVAQ